MVRVFEGFRLHRFGKTARFSVGVVALSQVEATLLRALALSRSRSKARSAFAVIVTIVVRKKYKLLDFRFDRVVQSWDTANKATELSDFSVCTTWGIIGKKLYLLSVLRRRLEYPDLKRAVRDQQRLFQADVVLIEDKASGTQLIQELTLKGCCAVTKYKPECEKTMRMHAQTALIENGFVYIPETAPWLAGYLHELTVFPKGKHDDQVDSTAQFLDWLKKPMPSWGIYEYYRQQAEALLAAERGEEVKPPTDQLPDLMEIYRRAREGYGRHQNVE